MADLVGAKKALGARLIPRHATTNVMTRLNSRHKRTSNAFAFGENQGGNAVGFFLALKKRFQTPGRKSTRKSQPPPSSFVKPLPCLRQPPKMPPRETQPAGAGAAPARTAEITKFKTQHFRRRLQLLASALGSRHL
jgi:hypothetical protein